MKIPIRSHCGRLFVMTETVTKRQIPETSNISASASSAAGRGDQLVFFRYCPGTLLAHNITRRKAADSASKFWSRVWHADSPTFETSLSSLHNGRLLLTANYRKKNGWDHSKLSSYDVKNGELIQRRIEPRAQSAVLSLPFKEDTDNNFIYCFASPFFELGLLHSYISETMRWEELLSANALQDSIIKRRLPILQLLLQTKHIGLKFFVVEWATYMLDEQVDALVHKEVVTIFRKILKEYLKFLNIPLIELSPDLVDENMFLSPRFMQISDYAVAKGRSFQLRHPGQEFIDIMIDATLEFLGSVSWEAYPPLDIPSLWPRWLHSVSRLGILWKRRSSQSEAGNIPPHSRHRSKGLKSGSYRFSQIRLSRPYSKVENASSL
jgi:hypothetical protein